MSWTSLFMSVETTHYDCRNVSHKQTWALIYFRTPLILAEYDRSLHADQQSQYNLYLKMKGSVRKLDLKNYKFFVF